MGHIQYKLTLFLASYLNRKGVEKAQLKRNSRLGLEIFSIPRSQEQSAGASQ
jgi:hypothetical protein